MKLKGNSILALAREIRAAIPAEYLLSLDLGDVRIDTWCSTPELREALAHYFTEFLSPEEDKSPADIDITIHEGPSPELNCKFRVKTPGPGKTKIKEEWAGLPDGRIVRKRLTSMVFFFGRGVNAALGSCLENSNQVINFINNRFIEWQLNRGCLLGHAAAVAHAGRGMALAGFSGMGKSTLALHLMSRGATFVSNDRVMVEENGQGLRIHGVTKQPRINPGTALNNPDLECVIEPENIKRFKSLPPEELWELEHKYDALIHECYGPNRFQLSTDMDGLVILNWKLDGGETIIRRVAPARRLDLLPAFMKATGLFYLPEDSDKAEDPGPEKYAALLSKGDVLEIAGGVDFDKAAEACLAYLETGKLPGE